MRKLTKLSVRVAIKMQLKKYRNQEEIEVSPNNAIKKNTWRW